MSDDYTLNNDDQESNNAYNEDDDDDEASVNSPSVSLSNPYLTREHAHRANLGDKKLDALKKWKRMVRIWSICLILCGGVLMYSDLWYANVVGFAAGGIALYGVQKENSEFLFVYLVLLFLELLKNVGVFVYFVSGKGSGDTIKTILSCSFVIIEELFVVPANIYCSFRLYRTIKFSNDNDLDETLSSYK